MRTVAPTIRAVRSDDLPRWRVLWDGYNAFYGRSGTTALPEAVTASTWARFLDPAEPVHALVAECDGAIVGIVHYVFHRSTTRVADVCYLQDLFTDETMRGRGVARRLIEAVAVAARASRASRVYWQTRGDNATARLLYDRIAKYDGFIVYAHDV